MCTIIVKFCEISLTPLQSSGAVHWPVFAVRVPASDIFIFLLRELLERYFIVECWEHIADWRRGARSLPWPASFIHSTLLVPVLVSTTRESLGEVESWASEAVTSRQSAAASNQTTEELKTKVARDYAKFYSHNLIADRPLWLLHRRPNFTSTYHGVYMIAKTGCGTDGALHTALVWSQLINENFFVFLLSIEACVLWWGEGKTWVRKIESNDWNAVL